MEVRKEDQRDPDEKVVEIEIERLRDFKNHPFKVQADSQMKGLQQLIKTIGRVKKQLNPKFKIEGILLTMADYRTNYARDISMMVYDTYSASIKVFGSEIPMSVRAAEVSVEGKSIYSYDPKGKVACAYKGLRRIKERMQRAEQKDSVIAELKEKKKETEHMSKKQRHVKEKGER